jgi:hypothetical protein
VSPRFLLIPSLAMFPLSFLASRSVESSWFPVVTLGIAQVSVAFHVWSLGLDADAGIALFPSAAQKRLQMQRGFTLLEAMSVVVPMVICWIVWRFEKTSVFGLYSVLS